jgi:hypothetical protein
MTPHWTAYVSAILTPIVAIFAMFIARQQWNTARNKLRFDLFGERIKIYRATQRFLSMTMTNGRVDHSQLQTFLSGTRDTRWIVALEVEEYLTREIYEPAIRLQCLEAELSALTGESRSKNLSSQTALKLQLQKQFNTEVDRWFSGYLQLEH